MLEECMYEKAGKDVKMWLNHNGPVTRREHAGFSQRNVAFAVEAACTRRTRSWSLCVSAGLVASRRRRRCQHDARSLPRRVSVCALRALKASASAPTSLRANPQADQSLLTPRVHAMATRSNVTPSSYCFYQALSLAVLTTQNTALVLVTKYSYRPSAAPYYVTTVVACSELVKLILSYAFLITFDGSHIAKEALFQVPENAIRLAVPSVLYTIQNNLLFVGIQLLSPTSYMVCSQTKILTSAFWSVVLLRIQITRKQYVALVVLVRGMIMVQASEGNAIDVSIDVFTRQGVRGSVVVFLAALTSGFAGAYLEKMYKGVRRSIWFTNAQLAFFSLPMAVIGALGKDWKSMRASGGMFQGFDVTVFLIIALQAIGGLIVAVVLRYAGNVLKCYAVSISICSCAIATKAVSEQNRSDFCTSTVFGVVLVIGSTFLYSSNTVVRT